VGRVKMGCAYGIMVPNHAPCGNLSTKLLSPTSTFIVFCHNMLLVSFREIFHFFRENLFSVCTNSKTAAMVVA
jgi:hypothetical protein